jgi:hypothetical protein
MSSKSNSKVPRSATKAKKVDNLITLSEPLSTPQRSSSTFQPFPAPKPRSKKIKEVPKYEATEIKVTSITSEAVIEEVTKPESVVEEVIEEVKKLEAVIEEVTPITPEKVMEEVTKPEDVVDSLKNDASITTEENDLSEEGTSDTVLTAPIAAKNFVQSPTIPDVFLMQKIEDMDEDAKYLYRETLLTYFQVMQSKINAEEYATPVITSGTSLNMELNIYQNRMHVYVKRMSIESKVERYKLYLTFFWGMMELYGIANGFILMKGYTKMQLKIIACYDDILKELGEIQYSKEERKVVRQEKEEQGPFAKLFWSSCFNGILIMSFQYLCSFVSPGEGVNILGSLVDNVFNKNKSVSTGDKSMMSGVIKGVLQGLLPEKYLGLVDTFVIPLISGDGIVSSGSAREIETVPAEETLL